MALGNLVVRLGLDAAEFTSGLTKAEAQAQRFRRNLESQAASIARIATGIAAVGAAVGGAVLAVDRLAKSAATFKDMEERTGATAESLASLAVAAETAGVSMSDVEGMMQRLTKTLTGVDDESKAAGAALTALGIPIEDFKRLDPVGQFQRIAVALDGFQDGASKTAVAIALLGKSGAQALPFLRELAGESGRQTILTQAQIERADAYADAQARATAQLRLYASAAATEALPAFTAFTAALSSTAKELTGVTAITAAMSANNSVQTFAANGARALGLLVSGAQLVARGFEQAGVAIAGVAANIAALARGDISGAANIVREMARDISAIGNRPLFSQQLEQSLQAQRNIARGMAAISKDNEDRLDRLARKPQLNFDGAIRSAKALRSEVDELAKFLDRLRGEEFAASIGLDSKSVDDLTKLAEASRKFGLSLAEQERLTQRILDSDSQLKREQDEMTRALGEAVDVQVRAIQSADDYLQKLRDEAGAIGLTTEALADYNAELARRDATKGITDPTVLDLVNRSIDAAKALAIENVAREKAAQATERGIAAGKDLVKRYEDELGALGKTGVELERYAINLERQAALLGVTDEAQRAYINSLYDTATALAETLDQQKRFYDDARALNEQFSSSFADNVAAIADGSKSFKDAVKSMADDWVKALNRMAANKLAEAIFGGNGGFDFGKLFSGLFNGFGGGGFGGGGGSFGGGGFGGGFADGGFVRAGVPILVGERGPELLVPRVSGEIISNENLRKAGDTTNIHAPITVNVPASTSRQSATQIATEVGIKVQRALARNT